MERNYQMLILVGIIGLVSVLIVMFSKEIGNYFGGLQVSENGEITLFTWYFPEWIYGIIFVVIIVFYIIRRIVTKRG